MKVHAGSIIFVTRYNNDTGELEESTTMCGKRYLDVLKDKEFIQDVASPNLLEKVTCKECLRILKKEKKMIKLGQTVKEVVTGIKGIAMARTQYYTGCSHIGICPREPVKKDGKIEIPDWVWVDETRCIIIDENILQLGQPEIKDSVSGSFPHAPSN